jgi:Uma2 family endonuclease
MRMAKPFVPTRERFGVDQFIRMAEVGILPPDPRVELVDGEVMRMPPIGSRHAFVVDSLAHEFRSKVSDEAWVSAQNPLRLSPYDLVLPDVMLLRPMGTQYRHRLPQGGDVLLVVEIAETTLAYDSTWKLQLYARAALPEYWLIDLSGRCAVVCREPGNDSYASRVRFGPGDTLSPLALPNVSLALNHLLAD